MNTDELTALFQKGVRVTLGAATAAAEAIQNQQLRDETWDQMQKGEFNQLTDVWAEKGERAEAEIQQFVGEVVSGQAFQGPSNASQVTVDTTAKTVPADSNVQADLKELTAKLSQLRSELETLRQNKN